MRRSCRADALLATALRVDILLLETRRVLFYAVAVRMPYVIGSARSAQHKRLIFQEDKRVIAGEWFRH